MKKYLPHIIIFTFFFGLSLSLVRAQGVTIPPQGNPPPQSFTVHLDNPFNGGNSSSLTALFTSIINNIVLPLGSIAAVLGFIYSGFLYVKAQGNPSDITKANNALLNTAIGTAILLGSWVIAQVIENTLNQLKT